MERVRLDIHTLCKTNYNRQEALLMYKGKKILKPLLALAIIAGALFTIVPAAVNAMGTKQEETINDDTKDKIEELRDELQKMEQEQVVSDEQEYKDTSDKLGDLELKYGKFDYQKEVDLRLATLKASLEDIKKEIERNTDSEIKSDLEYRYKELTLVYQKYNKIVENTKDESAYEEIAFSLNNDLESAYEKINN